jgi:branched-chain amino acid aminotransferase
MPGKIYYYCDGKYIQREKATVSIHDIGLLRGFAIFDSLRTYRGKPYLIREHYQRLFRGLKFSGIKLGYTIAEMEKLAAALIRKNGIPDVLIRTIVTGGHTHSLIPEKDPTVLILADPIHAFPAWQYEKGIALKTTTYPRVIPEVKSTVYFSAVLETQKALKEGFHEVVYIDSKKGILEGTTFNVFAVLPGPKLVTAKDQVLAGITAQRVIDIAKKLKIPVLRTALSPSILKKSREIFITSSNRELIPVIRIDRLRIGNGKPGSVRERLHQEYRKDVSNRLKVNL